MVVIGPRSISRRFEAILFRLFALFCVRNVLYRNGRRFGDDEPNERNEFRRPTLDGHLDHER